MASFDYFLANAMRSFQTEDLALLTLTAALVFAGYSVTKKFKSWATLGALASAAAFAWYLPEVAWTSTAAVVLGCGIVALECRVPTSGFFGFSGFAVILVAALNLCEPAAGRDAVTLLGAFPAALLLTIEYTVVGVMIFRGKSYDVRSFGENLLFPTWR